MNGPTPKKGTRRYARLHALPERGPGYLKRRGVDLIPRWLYDEKFARRKVLRLKRKEEQS